LTLAVLNCETVMTGCRLRGVQDAAVGRWAVSPAGCWALAVVLVGCGTGQVGDAGAAGDGLADVPHGDAVSDVAETSDGAEGPCSGDMALVQPVAVCIDRYESSRGPDGQAVSVAGVFPWVDVTWSAAGEACAAAGKRLCSSDEWTAACAGPDARLFPWGDEPIVGWCANGGLLEPVPTGSFLQCDGWYPGVFDLIGNVAEWTSTWLESPMIPAGYLMRGGSVNGNDGDTCLSTSFTGNRDLGYELTGFRCCRAPR
jgi:hypothetical protein